MRPNRRGRPRRYFGPADEHPYRRLVADWVKLIVAVVLTIATARHAGGPTAAEGSVRQFFISLPDGLEGIFRSLLGLGTLWGVGLVVAAALLARRWRLSLVLALAGVVAWGAGRFVGFLAAGDSAGTAFGNVFDGTTSGPYPVMHLTVLGAIILAAAPFLTRPTRRAGGLLLALLVVGALYRGLGGVNDVFGALVIAWGTAALLHLAFGSPAGRPTTEQVAAALHELGQPVASVALAPTQAHGFTRMNAVTAAGETLPVRVYGRDAADTRLLAKAWHFVAFKDSGPTLTITRLQQVEHEALCLFVARDAGVPVPQVVTVGIAGPSAAILVTRPPEMAALSADDALIEGRALELWRDVGRMRDVHLAHGALDLDHVSASGDSAVIHDFALGSVSASGERLDRDVAQLLVGTAGLLGEESATRTAIAGIGPEPVGAALPYLQKPALTRTNRQLARRDKDLLDRLRAAVTAETGRDTPDPIELRRVKPLNIVMFAALAFAVWVILAQIGSISELIDTLKTAQLPWALTGFVLAQCTAVAFATVTIGSVSEAIPLVPATILQMAISFTNMVAPSSAASTVMNIRFLQKQGVEVGAATSSGVLAGLSGTIAQFSLFIISGLVVGQEIRLGEIGGGDRDNGRVILLVVFLAAVAVAISLAIPKIRRVVRDKVWPQVVSAIRNIWGILTTPRQLAFVLGGSIAAQLLYALCLLACLLAYGGSLPLLEVVFVNTSASFLASMTPVPGGIGIQEASLIAGLTAFGVAPEIATAAVITHRLFTTYLPPIWGSYATKRLVADGYL